DPTAPGGPVLSVQKLETFAKCPLSYFFKYILSVTTPEEPGMATADWLTALETGSRLHEIFRLFIEELMAQGRPPSVARDHGRLHSILQQCLDQSKRDHPPPSMSAYHRQVRLLERAADIFLVEEEIASRSSIPRFVEVSIGLRKSGELTVLDQETTEALEIEPGVRIRIQGRVDRIDESTDAAKGYIVWDYKTGGTYRYRGNDLFRQGRNLQHALYTAIVAALLKRRLHPDARVHKFGYYFPSVKGRGVRIVSADDAVQIGNEIVTALCRLMSRGCFPATNDAKEDCQFCEYAAVCGDVETAASQSRSKIANQANETLADFRWIRGI
ncbi:MAG: PD-(D/E)XK nuclease family protein, partial [Desulfomonilaceae bacterium]